MLQNLDVTLDITRKNFLYWILNVEIYLDAMNIVIQLNIEIKHLSNMTKIYIVKRDFTNIVNLFHAYVWLAGQSNKAFDEKS